MELCAFSLLEHVEKHGTKICHGEKISYGIDIASGMAYLHSQNIVHRDLGILCFDNILDFKISLLSSLQKLSLQQTGNMQGCGFWP